jgi:hypothetical protein
LLKNKKKIMRKKVIIDANAYSNFSIGNRQKTTNHMGAFGINNLNAIATGYLAEKKANQQAIDYATTQGTPRSMDLGQGQTLDLGQRPSGSTEDVMTQPEYSINSAIAIISEHDKPALVKLLQKTGSFVTPLSSRKSLFDASFKAIQDSPIFRKKLEDYIVEQVTGTELPKPRSQKDGSLIRIAQGSFPTLGRGNRGSKIEASTSSFSSFSDFDDNFANNNGEGKAKVKKLLGSIFTEENAQKLVGLGMDYASTRLNANAQKGTNKDAINYEKAQTEKALAQAQLEEAKGKTPQVSTPDDKKGGKKWVMPVAIGGGVLVLGTIIYFVMKKKK